MVAVDQYKMAEMNVLVNLSACGLVVGSGGTRVLKPGFLSNYQRATTDY